jgi:hypothetical protein
MLVGGTDDRAPGAELDKVRGFAPFIDTVLGDQDGLIVGD